MFYIIDVHMDIRLDYYQMKKRNKTQNKIINCKSKKVYNNVYFLLTIAYNIV